MSTTHSETDVITCLAGQVICSEGEPGDRMYIVLSGRTRISTQRSGEVAILGSGEFFGEMAIIDAHPRSATAVALDDGTRILPVDQARFVYLVSHQPAFSLAVMAVLSRRLRSMGLPVADPAAKPADHAYQAIAIRPDLWQFRSRGRASNVYLFAGHHRTVLIDTGLPSTYPSLAAALAGVGHPPESIDYVILTHEHADHVGGVPLLPGKPVIAAHPLAANKLALGDDFATVNNVIGEDIEPVRVDLWLPEGAVIDVAPYRLEVILTPGHTSGCICLADPAQDVIVCGDTFMAGGAMGGIFGSGNISDYVLSLQRLSRMRLGTALPGHGRVSLTGGVDVAAALQRAEALLSDTRQLFHAMSGREAFDQILTSVHALNR